MAVLAEKDVNAQSGTGISQTSDASMGSTMDEKKQRQPLLQHNKASENSLYVSPSDAIMSPASQKLAGFKQRQINKQINPTRRTLFARTVSSTSSASDEQSPDTRSAS